MMSFEPTTIILRAVPVCSVLWTAICIWIGFWMGRQVAEKPLPPVFEKKSEPPMIEEDPYWEPMHGKPQNRIPTVDGGKG